MTHTPPADASATENIMSAQAAAAPQVFRMVDSRTPASQTKDARSGGCGCGGCGCGGKGKKARTESPASHQADN